jgi:hypothetical protein
MHELIMLRRHKTVRSLRIYKHTCKQLLQQQRRHQKEFKKKYRRLLLKPLRKYNHQHRRAIQHTDDDSADHIANQSVIVIDDSQSLPDDCSIDDNNSLDDDFNRDWGDATDWETTSGDIVDFLDEVDFIAGDGEESYGQADNDAEEFASSFGDESVFDTDRAQASYTYTAGDGEETPLNKRYAFSPTEVRAALYATDFYSYMVDTKGIAIKQATSNMTRITWIIQFIMQRDPEVIHYQTLADVTAAIIRGGYKLLQQLCTWLSEKKHRQPSTVNTYLRPFQLYLKWFTALSVDNTRSIHEGKVTRDDLLIVEEAIDDIRSAFNRQVE